MGAHRPLVPRLELTAAVLWYFAYGSNLDPDTFQGRRRMRPLATRLALLREHRLVFDLPVGRGERGVANLLPEAGECVHGVAYQLTESAACWLDRTEGVPRAYQRMAIAPETRDGERFQAFTYLSPHRHPSRKPSRRYLGLLLKGARFHGLPEEWITFLRGLPLALDERVGQRELFGDP